MSSTREVPIRPWQGVLLSVAVSVAGREETFLLDTGAGITTLDAALAKRLGLEPYGRAVAHRMSDERVDLRWVDDPGLELGGERLPAPAFGVFDIGSLLPPDWPPLGGALGLDVLAGRRVVLDLPAGRLVLPDEQSFARRIADLAPLRARIARRVMGASLDVYVAARARRGTVWLEVDTGNTGPTVLASHAVDQMGLSPGDPVELEGFGPIDGAWVEKDLNIDGNLGQDALRDRVLALDLREGRAWLG